MQLTDDRSLLRFSPFLLVSALIASAIPSAQATGFFRFENRRENPGALRLLPEISSLSTVENFNAAGSKTTVPGLGDYKKNSLDLTAVYGINRQFSVFARASAASVSFTAPGLNASGSGLTEQGLGANYRLWESVASTEAGLPERAKSINAQIQFDIPLYDNVSLRLPGSRAPLRGDGTFDTTLAGFGTLPLNQGSGTRLYLLGGAGFTIRNGSYSKAIPYQVQLVGLPETSGLLYRVGIHGFKSMTTDTTNVTSLSPQSQLSPGILDPQDAGRSFIVDALNSTYMSAKATLGYQWGEGDQLYVSYLMPMSGSSTAVLSGIFVGAQFRFPGSKSSSSATAPSETTAKNAYDLEARVKQANDRLNLIKIDKGENDGIEKGHVIDIFRVNSDGTPNDLVARGVVTGVTANESVVNLRQYKKEIWIQPGFLARRITPSKSP